MLFFFSKSSYFIGVIQYYGKKCFMVFYFCYRYLLEILFVILRKKLIIEVCSLKNVVWFYDRNIIIYLCRKIRIKVLLGLYFRVFLYQWLEMNYIVMKVEKVIKRVEEKIKDGDVIGVLSIFLKIFFEIFISLSVFEFVFIFIICLKEYIFLYIIK